jgi:hypothetical protein
MLRDLNRRLARIEHLMDRPRFGDGDHISTVIVKGGLPGPMAAYVPETGDQLPAWDGEMLPEFRRRAVEWAGEAGAAVVVISGVPV